MGVVGSIMGSSTAFSVLPSLGRDYFPQLSFRTNEIHTVLAGVRIPLWGMGGTASLYNFYLVVEGNSRPCKSILRAVSSAIVHESPKPSPLLPDIQLLFFPSWVPWN